MVLRAVGENDRTASILAALIADSTPSDLRFLAQIYARSGLPDTELATARRARELDPHWTPAAANVTGDIVEALERDGQTDRADAATATVDWSWDRARIRRRQICVAIAAGRSTES